MKKCQFTYEVTQNGPQKPSKPISQIEFHISREMKNFTEDCSVFHLAIAGMEMVFSGQQLCSVNELIQISSYIKGLFHQQINGC